MPLDATAWARAPYEQQSASLLASQPLTISDPPELRDWSDIWINLERRLAGLRAWRWSWWDTWQQLAAYFLPRRSKPWVVANNYTRGAWLNDAIIDTTGSMAALKCAAGVWSGLTNPARPWFGFGPAIEGFVLDQEAREWLTASGRKVAAVLHQSNFYGVMAQFFQDETVFGTAPVIVYEDEEDVIRCYLPCVGEYFLQVSSRLSVDVLYREEVKTVAQIVEQFTLEKCPFDVKRLWQQGGSYLDVEYIIAHAIEPNTPMQGLNGRKFHPIPERFVYREFYWIRGKKDKWPLSRRGFMDKPFAVGRWTVTSNDPYGRGPGFDALGDQKQVQLQTRRKAEFLEKGVRPPMIADPSMKNEPASVMPGMVTFVNTANGNAGFKPAFEVQAIWLQHMTVDITSVNKRIEDCFYIPQFMAITMMQGVQPRNELELTKRDLERLQVLGPMISLFEQEVASPVIQRVMRIMQRRGMIDPMPQSLRGIPLTIKYMSLMRMAQRAAESIAMKDGFATAGSLSAAAKAAGVPDPMRIMKLDESLEHYLDLNNYPLNLIYTKQEVEQHDQMRLQVQQQEKNQQLMSEVSGPAVQAAGILSKTPVQGGSYLSSLLSGNTAPG